MSKPVCAIVGAGPGNGAAFARKFAAEGHAVALCARNEARLKAFEQDIPGTQAFACDVHDPASIKTAFERIDADLGPVSVLIYNAGAGQFANIDDATAETFQAAWEVNARGLFLAAKAVLDDMRELGGGSIIVIGATASLRGGAGFAPFASAKAAQRSLAQSMARHLGAENIHVAYLIIDGMIDLHRTRAAMPDRPDEDFMQPADIAESVYFLTQQPKSAWTFELDLRPFGEKW